jgi:hypothetical protein
MAVRSRYPDSFTVHQEGIKHLHELKIQDFNI